MAYQILLNLGGHELAKEVNQAIKLYAIDLNVGQKELLFMALQEFWAERGEEELAKLLGDYQAYDGRRKH